MNGTISSTTDTDYFKVTLAPGKRFVSGLTAGASSGFGLGIYRSTGQQLILVPGVVGRSPQVQVVNGGATPLVLTVRVLRSVGSTGSYQLTLTP